MNGGKDVKIGHDKRPVSVVPSDEQLLYNIANGEILTDEFGNPLITNVDQFFLADTTAKRSTSVVFPSQAKESQTRRLIRTVGIATGTYGVNFDVHVLVTSVGFATHALLVDQRNGGIVGVGTTTPGKVVVGTTSGIGVTLANFPNSVEVKTRSNQGGDYNHIYFDEDNLSNISNVTLPTTLSSQTQYVIKAVGHGIPHNTYVSQRDYDRITLSNNAVVGAGGTSERIEFIKVEEARVVNIDNTLKVAEVFQETSEVSTTLLGVNRAETQLSLFSNVSSYGLNSDEWETFSYSEGNSFSSWDRRINKTYGNRFLTKIDEITKESAITVEAFPPSHSYPFGPKFAKLGLYNSNLYLQYLNFVRYGNDLHKLFSQKLSGYSSDWIDRFLDPDDVTPVGAGSAVEVSYKKLPGQNNFNYAFAKIDTWTDTYRDIARGSNIKDPITGEFLTFANLKERLASSSIGTGEVIRNIFDSGNTRPGYSTGLRRVSIIQSRRVFRYQPGRISGFTFGSRASTEPVPGMFNEWGVANKTDQYMFKIYAGQLSIIRRSTIPLSTDVLVRNGLDPTTTLSVNINGTSYNTVQPRIPSGDPYDEETYHTVEITRDKFNGDPLNGNGPSGYTIRPEKVTMWKIEFGWYGAIGARFYAYIPAGAGEARWIVVHTLVIENQLGQPCLQDSYFRFKYSVNVQDTANIRTPQYIYKYGASYYIDGGDEGTSEQFSTSTGLEPKQINKTSEAALIGIRPKDVIINSTGTEIANRKLIIPTKLSMSSDSLTEVKVKTCKACPGFGHVFTPGVGTTVSGRNMEISFLSGNSIIAIGTDSYFTENDIGTKIIAPSLFNAYITSVDTPLTGTTYGGPTRYESAKVYGWGPGLNGYPNYATARQVGGTNAVIDYGLINPLTGIGGSQVSAIGLGTYPHQIRLSNYDVHFASEYPIYGSKIEVQFINPNTKDGISSYKSDTHWADFMIGLTDKKPTTAGPSLTGWDAEVLPWTQYQGVGAQGGSPSPATVGMTTSRLPNDEILFGESTHTHAGMNEDGFETSESWSPTPFQVRMGVDSRIPSVSNPGGGRCSLATFEVAVPSPISPSNTKQIYQQNPETGATDASEGYYLKVEGTFASSITDWVGGQVVYRDPSDVTNNIPTPITFELTSRPSGSVVSRKPITFVDGSGVVFSYIKISGDIGTSDPNNITVIGRPVTLTASVLGGVKSKLFKYSVFPLYLVGKLMDNSKINNISVKETIGETQKTTSPQLSVTNGSVGFIDTYSGNAESGTPPTNFTSVKRLSSSEVDIQNEQKLRENGTVTKDIFYVGANTTQEVNMSKIFGVDRNVITPDNLNLEATFLTAKKIDGDNTNNTGSIQLTLNYKEQ
jgi:hypothetical protein